MSLQRQRAPASSLRVGLLCATLIALAACGSAGATDTASPSAATRIASPAVTPASPANSSSTDRPDASMAPSASANPTPTPALVKIEGSIRVQNPVGLAVSGDAVWAPTSTGAVRIDSRTNALTAIKFGSGNDEIDGITADESAAWVTDFDASMVYRIDSKTLRVVAQIPVGLNPEEIFSTPDAVWVANHRDGTVSRIDPHSNRVAATIKIGPTGPSGPQWVAVGLGSVWVSVPSIDSVVRIDAQSNSILATIVGAHGGIAVSNDVVWVVQEHSAARIDPKTNQIVATVDIGGDANDPAVIGNAPWFVVAHPGSPGNLVRIDPATNQVDRVLRLLDEGGSTPLELSDATLARTTAAKSLWIADLSEPGQVFRVPIAAISGQ